VAEDAPADDAEPKAEGEDAAEDAAPAEPEAKEMSLEEYEALMAEKKAALNKARAERKVDASEFDGLKAVVKPEEEELQVGGAKEKKVRAKERKVAETVATGFRVETNEPRAEFGGRGRGRGRGGAGRGEGRGAGRGAGGRGRGDYAPRAAPAGGRGAPAPRAAGGAAINVGDDSAFPALA
jgi:plasminogen activator inhibitor 1 RNA-binding protein